MASFLLLNSQVNLDNIEIEFLKKASSTITFTCEEGIKLIEAVQQAIDTGQGVKVTINSIGTLTSGEIASRIKITWSFKVKRR